MGENLSPRINSLLQQGIDGEDFWDVCCDHGYLGQAAISRATFARVHFVDRVPHIIENLKDKVGESERTQFFSANAENIPQAITGTAVIAGVGGFNIIKILEQWTARDILRAKRIVLNPLTHIAALRDYLNVWGPYKIKETLIVRERERDREIIILEAAVPDIHGLSAIQ